MATFTDTTSAIRVHSAVAALRDAALGSYDEETGDVMTLAAGHARDEAISVPATNYNDVRIKLQMLIDDAGCGLVEVEGLQFVLRDMDALNGRLQ